MGADGYQKPAKHQKRTLFTLQHPRHFSQFSGGAQGRSEDSAYRTSADPEHAYLSERELNLLTSAVQKQRSGAGKWGGGNSVAAGQPKVLPIRTPGPEPGSRAC